MCLKAVLVQMGVIDGTNRCKDAVGGWERASSTLETDCGDELKVTWA